MKLQTNTRSISDVFSWRPMSSQTWPIFAKYNTEKYLRNTQISWQTLCLHRALKWLLQGSFQWKHVSPSLHTYTRTDSQGETTISHTAAAANQIQKAVLLQLHARDFVAGLPVNPQASAKRKVLQDIRKKSAVSNKGKSRSLVNLVTWWKVKGPNKEAWQL